MKRWHTKIDEHTCDPCRSMDGVLVPEGTFPPLAECESEAPCRCGVEQAFAEAPFAGTHAFQLGWGDRLRLLLGRPLVVSTELVVAYFDGDRSIDVGPARWLAGAVPFGRPAWTRWGWWRGLLPSRSAEAERAP